MRKWEEGSGDTRLYFLLIVSSSTGVCDRLAKSADSESDKPLHKANANERHHYTVLV